MNLSPAEQIYPGERTGRFRIGGNQPVVDANGQSRISYEDCAVAIIDEAELPRHINGDSRSAIYEDKTP